MPLTKFLPAAVAPWTRKSPRGRTRERLNKAGTQCHVTIPGFRHLQVEMELESVTFEEEEVPHLRMLQPLWRSLYPLFTSGGFLTKVRYEGGDVDPSKFCALVFIKGSNVMFTKDYFKAYSKFMSRGADTVLESHAYISHIGNSSFSLRMQMKDAGTGRFLAKFELFYVRVGFESRRPLPLDDDLRKLNQTTIPDKSVELFQTDVPCDSKLLWFEETVLPDYIDLNGHCNIRFYELFAFKGVVQWMRSRNLSIPLGIEKTKDLKVCKRNVSFKGESLEGEVLTVGTWQCEKMPTRFFSVIRKSGRDIVLVEVECLLDTPEDYLKLEQVSAKL